MNDRLYGIQYTLLLIILGILAFSTGEIVTFTMLGFVILILTNIFNVLKDISRQLSLLDIKKEPMECTRKEEE